MPGEVAVSNAPEVESTPVTDGMVRHVFAASKPLPTSLTAFMVGPFATAAGQVAPDTERSTPLPVRIIATQPNRQNLQFALASTGLIVRDLERYLGTPLPFAKLAHLASPAGRDGECRCRPLSRRSLAARRQCPPDSCGISA